MVAKSKEKRRDCSRRGSILVDYVNTLLQVRDARIRLMHMKYGLGFPSESEW